MSRKQPEASDDRSSARHFAPGGALLLLALFASSAGALTPQEADGLLARADGVKSSTNSEFVSLIARLDEHAAQLSPYQRQYLGYLKGWQSAYAGDYETAIPVLKSIIEATQDATLKFRAAASAANVLAVATRYDEALAQLSQLLTLLPDVSDHEARQQGLAVIGYLYNQVGEYDLGLQYADELTAEDRSDKGVCRGSYLKLEALYKSGKLRADVAEFLTAIDTCSKLGDLLRANAIRTYVARLYIDQGRFEAAAALLNGHYREIIDSGYVRMIVEYNSLLARSYQHMGDSASARQFALRAISSDTKSQNQYTEPLVIAYQLLYALALEQGDLKSALAYHENYAAADKGYLDDVSARQLAYERAKHEAAANRLQIDGLNKRNEVLQLQQALGKKAVETSRLYILLLITVVAFIALWAYRTKRSQLHFMKLARVDGLTGIANRHYFIAQAERALENSRKLQQEVCVILCDLDHFKSINDKYGHATGDHVLRQAVQECRRHLRASDLFGRFGGEEFCILLPSCSLADARQRCEQLRASIATVAADPGSMVANVSASFGVAATGSSGYELRQLLAHADAALYRAKYAGRNCVVLYDTMHAIGGAQPEPDLRIRGAARV